MSGMIKINSAQKQAVALLENGGGKSGESLFNITNPAYLPLALEGERSEPRDATLPMPLVIPRPAMGESVSVPQETSAAAAVASAMARAPIPEVTVGGGGGPVFHFYFGSK